MEQNIRILQEEMRKAATYEEHIQLEKKVNKLPTMTNIQQIDEHFDEYL